MKNAAKNVLGTSTGRLVLIKYTVENSYMPTTMHIYRILSKLFARQSSDRKSENPSNAEITFINVYLLATEWMYVSTYLWKEVSLNPFCFLCYVRHVSHTSKVGKNKYGRHFVLCTSSQLTEKYHITRYISTFLNKAVPPLS